jgi:hypothetical protein
MRRAAHLDSNHDDIVGWFEQYGAIVKSLAAVGDGWPDLIVCHRGRLILVEVKSAYGKLQPNQREIAQWWPVYEARTLDDVRAILTGTATRIAA